MIRHAALLLAGALCACGDPLSPPRSITIDICDGTFVAYRNQNTGWVVLGHAAGRYTFDATEKVVIAHTRHDSYYGTTLTMWYLTRDQAATRFRCEPFDAQPASVTGSVVGQPQYGWTMLMYGESQAYVPYSQTSYQVLPQQGSVNLVAVRYDSIGGQVVPGKAIIRRELTYGAGATIPALDFQSAEAFPFQQNTVSTAAGLVSGHTAFISRGHGLGLGSTFAGIPGAPVAARSLSIRTVPATRLAPGDLHSVSLWSGNRNVTRYFSAPTDLSLDIGPEAAEPHFTVVSSSPYTVRADVASQPEYPDEVWVSIRQHRPNGAGTIYQFVATREHIGRRPDTWSFTTPDLSALAGFPANVYLNQDFYSWQVTVRGGKFGLSWANAADGDVARSASRNSQ